MLSIAPLNEPDDTPRIVAMPQDLKPTLLVVDDEEGPRQSLRVVFKDEYHVLLASDGMAAIELARKTPVDVAVLDIRMGGMSGIELLGKLKEVDPAIEVVMMTAFETNDTIRQALRLSACDYINKPFDLVTMREAVAKAMKRRSFSAEVKNNAEKLDSLQSELAEQKLELQMDRDRGEIYAGIIHDINGPLTVISGLIQVINQRVGDQAEMAGEEFDKVKDNLKRITRQVTQCIEISRRYLSFLRRTASESSRVRVKDILKDLGDLLRCHPNMRGNQLVIAPMSQDVTVNIHGTDLIQILLNLTNNALKCTSQPHRVDIVAEFRTTPIDEALFEEGPGARFINRSGFENGSPLLALSVRDNGPGIPPEVMPRLFEPYFTTHPNSGGTGLGLCIVHRLLKEGRGGLRVEAMPGEGTVFTVYLPARVAEPGAEPAKA